MSSELQRGGDDDNGRHFTNSKSHGGKPGNSGFCNNIFLGNERERDKDWTEICQSFQELAPNCYNPFIKEDFDRVFTDPQRRAFVTVPLEFPDKKTWCTILAHNLLAEFYSWYQQSKYNGKLVSKKAKVKKSTQLAIPDVKDLTANSLLRIKAPDSEEGSLHIVTKGQADLLRVLKNGFTPEFTIKPGVPGKCSIVEVTNLGYIGSYKFELEALVELAEDSAPPDVLKCVLQPRQFCKLPGDYKEMIETQAPQTSKATRMNQFQLQTVQSLQWALEKIQGPPGTGKSTTVANIIQSRIPPGKRVLVTCTRNVAVEAIAQKLSTVMGESLLVCGSFERVAGSASRMHLLEARCERHVDLQSKVVFKQTLTRWMRLLDSSLKPIEFVASSRMWTKAFYAAMRHRRPALHLLYRTARALRERLTKILSYAPALTSSDVNAVKRKVLQSSRIILTTIASTGRLRKLWRDYDTADLQVHTVIVDECACTQESSTALFLRLRPRNLILIGDHKQLRPCTMVPPDQLGQSEHDRSLFERCVRASKKVHQLREQYRMAAPICDLVSKLFYHSVLKTPAEVAERRREVEHQPLVWVQVSGLEQIPLTGGRSFANLDQVEAVCSIVATLREAKGPRPSIAVLTFYKRQRFELTKSLSTELKVEVHTVDSCQGSEFDYVVLSTVRSHPRGGMGSLGFISNKQRMCVALSRARQQLVIVGNRTTMEKDSGWSQAYQQCSPSCVELWQPESQFFCSLSSTPGQSIFDLETPDMQLPQLKAAAMPTSEPDPGKAQWSAGRPQREIQPMKPQKFRRPYVSKPVRMPVWDQPCDVNAMAIHEYTESSLNVSPLFIEPDVGSNSTTQITTEQTNHVANIQFPLHSPQSQHVDLSDGFPSLQSSSSQPSTSSRNRRPPKKSGSAREVSSVVTGTEQLFSGIELTQTASRSANGSARKTSNRSKRAVKSVHMSPARRSESSANGRKSASLPCMTDDVNVRDMDVDEDGNFVWEFDDAVADTTRDLRGENKMDYDSGLVVSEAGNGVCVSEHVTRFTYAWSLQGHAWIERFLHRILEEESSPDQKLEELENRLSEFNIDFGNLFEFVHEYIQATAIDVAVRC